jgi:uncharacterized DUF497 family protein
MIIEFDPAKNARNIAERGLSFELAVDFDFETAKVWQDTRSNTLNRALLPLVIWTIGYMRWCFALSTAASCHQLS